MNGFELTPNKQPSIKSRTPLPLHRIARMFKVILHNDKRLYKCMYQRFQAVLISLNFVSHMLTKLFPKVPHCLFFIVLYLFQIKDWEMITYPVKNRWQSKQYATSTLYCCCFFVLFTIVQFRSVCYQYFIEGNEHYLDTL